METITHREGEIEVGIERALSRERERERGEGEGGGRRPFSQRSHCVKLLTGHIQIESILNEPPLLLRHEVLCMFRNGCHCEKSENAERRREERWREG